MSFAAEEASVAKWFFGGNGSRTKLSRGICSWEEERTSGEESGEGEALVAPE